MKIPAWMVGEFFGTFLIVFIGCGVVAAAVLTGAQLGLFQVAMVWGLGIAVAIYLTGGLSGAHLNPAVTCALATGGDFPARRVLPYVAVQMAAAFVAAAAVHAVFAGPLAAYEAAHGIVRGAVGSEATAMIFGEFFPNPGGRALTVAARGAVSPMAAFCVEALGTAVLVVVIFGVADRRNSGRLAKDVVPMVIGLTVTLLISLLAPLTQAGFNPARDLGPRIWSAVGGGWGVVPFTANGWGWLTVYVVAPLVGGQAGAILYRAFFRPGHRAEVK